VPEPVRDLQAYKEEEDEDEEEESSVESDDDDVNDSSVYPSVGTPQKTREEKEALEVGKIKALSLSKDGLEDWYSAGGLSLPLNSKYADSHSIATERKPSTMHKKRRAMLAVLALASTTALNIKSKHITPPKLPRQCAAAFASLVVAAAAPFSASAAMSDPAAVGRCVVSQCTGKLARCLTSPKCAANLVCINSCTGRKDESECQIRCGDLFENEVVGDFNACAVSQKKCVPQRQDDGAYPEPSPEAIVKKFDTRVFDGRWYISAGLNDAFDTFDCQVHFFNAPTPKTLYGQLNWRITEPDGEFFTRDTIQRFVEDEKRPGILYNHDNEYLHYQDDWYILDYEAGKGNDDSDAFVLVY